MRTQRGRAEGEARGKPGSSRMKPICNQTPSPGLLSISSDSFIKSPASTGTVPVLLLCAPGESPADQRGAAPPPTSPPLGSSTYRSPQPSRQAGGSHQRQVCTTKGSKLSWLSSITPGSASHVPAGLLGASSRLPRPRCSPRGRGADPGVGETPGQSRQRVAASSRPSYGSPAPFQLLQLSTRRALRSFWPFRFLINFISIA